MIGKTLCILFVWGTICSTAEDLGRDLKQDVVNGQQAIGEISKKTEANVDQFIAKTNEVKSYFTQATKRYEAEGSAAARASLVKLDMCTKKYVADAVDKNKGVNAFRCMYKVNIASVEKSKSIEAAFSKSITALMENKIGEVEDLAKQMELISSTIIGLYRELQGSVKNCQTKDCIANLVHAAERKENNMKKVTKSFENELANQRIQFNNGALATLDGINKENQKLDKECETKMKACLGN